MKMPDNEAGKIRSLPNERKFCTDDMPRERLQRLGAAALADYELLAILLRTGSGGKNVLEFARELLAARGGLAGLFVSHFEELLAIKGLGKAKIAEILAVAELSRRFLHAELSRSEWTFAHADDVRDFLLVHYKHLGFEEMGMILLDQRHRFLAFERLVQGSAATLNVPVRALLEGCFRHHAAAVILVHNHPAGTPQPSQADCFTTRTLEQVLDMIDIRLLDHFIVAGNRVVSMRENGGW